MNRHDARKLSFALVILGVIIMLSSYLYQPLFIIGVIVLFSCLIPDFLYNKCPHCGKYLGKNNGAFCQYCGEKLD